MTFDFTETRPDAVPYRDSRFHVEIDGVVVGGFTDVSGLRVESSVVEYREGGVNEYTHKFPDRVHASNVTLYRGITGYNEFFRWVAKSTSTERETVQRDVIVTMADKQGQEVRGWVFINAYPIRWEGPRMHANGTNVAMEMVEFTHEGIETVDY